MKWSGRTLGTGVGCYLLVKQLLNAVVGGFGGTDVVLLLIAAAATVCLWRGVKKANIVVAVYMMLIACAFLPGNLRRLGLNVFLLYSMEGVLDMLLAVLLTFHPAIRSHCQMGT